MNAPWSPQQREWLQALGHEVLMLAGAAAPSEELSPAAASSACRAVSPRGSAGTAHAGNLLLRAVLRAAGRRDIGELAAWLPDAATLQGNAAAKRALWPRLRALRKPPREA